MHTHGLSRSAQSRGGLPLHVRAGLLSVTGLLSACFYISDYVPPNDGRARVIWRDNHMVPVLPGTSRLGAPCAEAVANLARLRYVSLWGSSYKHGPYPDAIEDALNNMFASKTIVRLIDRDKIWSPIYYKSISANKEQNPYDVFDASLLRSSAPDKSDKPVAADSNVIESALGVGALNHFDGSQISYPDDISSVAYRSIAHIGGFLALPFFAVGSNYVLFEMIGSPYPIASSANIVGAYNDLARTPSTPCSHPSTDKLRP